MLKRLVRCFVPVLAATTLLAETRIPEFQNEPQPGILRLSGVSASDRVFVDGDFLGDGKRLATFGSQLLISPGSYEVVVVTSTNQVACRSQIPVHENSIAVARCARPERNSNQELD